MSNEVPRRSATIYAFSARRGPDTSRVLEETKRVGAASRAAPHIVWGGSWYHEAAMRDADPARR